MFRTHACPEVDRSRGLRVSRCLISGDCQWLLRGPRDACGCASRLTERSAMSAPMQAQTSVLGLLSSCTRLSRVVAGILISSYAAQLVFPSCRQYLALVAGR